MHVCEVLHIRAFLFTDISCLQVWAGPLSGNRLAVVLWNRCEESANIIVKLPSIGLDGSSPYSVRDLWKVS